MSASAGLALPSPLIPDPQEGRLDTAILVLKLSLHSWFLEQSPACSSFEGAADSVSQ